MLCRHTVPDWHRVLDARAEPVPIFAACRLLVKQGETVRDPRSIGCAFWGRQRECPLYEGPGERIGKRAAWEPASAAADIPVSLEAVWPVRPPGAREGWQWLLAALGGMSLLLLLGAGVGVIGLLQGSALGTGVVTLVLGAAGVSIATLVLAWLRVWARRSSAQRAILFQDPSSGFQKGDGDE